MKKYCTFMFVALLSVAWLGIDVSAAVAGQAQAAERDGPQEKPWRLEQRTHDHDFPRGTEFLSEDFSGNELPAGWTTEELGDPGLGWEFDNELAFIDSDAGGAGGVNVAGTLTTPALDLSGATNVTLALNHYYWHLGNSFGQIRISTDGNSWEVAYEFSETIGSSSYPLFEYDITEWAAGESEVYIQFLYDDGESWAWWWEIDNVLVYEEGDIYEVTFTVVENTAEEDPIEGAMISVDGEQLVTDADGMASIMLADDTYTANISASGYVAEEVTFTVDGEDKTVDVHMMDDIVPPFNLHVELIGPNEALFSWNEYDEFRYDDGVVDAQLGVSGGDLNSVLGAAHHNDAVLYETAWYLTDEGGPHNTVKVWVLGLDANGMPDRNNVLYTAENVPNTNNQWNTYIFAETVEAPDGFFIGLSYNGFLGLAVDDGVGEPWDFVPGTQFVVFDITDPTSAFTDLSNFGFEVNYLLRAYGTDQGDIDFGRQELPLASGPAPELIPMDKPVNAGSPFNPAGHKAFLGFNVYLDGNLVEEEIAETEYLFTDLPDDMTFTAGVRAVYTTGESDVSTIEFEVPAIPIANWAIYTTALLIGLFVFFRIRKVM